MTQLVWCSRCGSQAQVAARSLDPRHPLVLCPRLNTMGELAHPGYQVGILDAGELTEAMEALRRRREREAHRRHTDALVRSCLYCQALLAPRPAHA